MFSDRQPLLLNPSHLQCGSLLAEIQEEVNKQPELLSAFAQKKLPCVPRDSLLVGAGDSYVAGQCAALLSSFRCIAVDPYLLISAPKLSRGRTVVFISVSGRTRSNIVAAKKVSGIARSTLGVTANSDSPLAGATDKALVIPYQYKSRAPGTLSFTLSLVAALKLASVGCDCGFSHLFGQAESQASILKFSEGGCTFFLGNHAAYAAALYAAAKTYEFFGERAQAELLEEFSHMELFSLRKDDAVNIFSSADPSGVSGRLARALTARGYRAALVESRGADRVEETFHAIFVTQLAVVQRMRANGLVVPYFMKSRQKLGLSDAMIY